jgi:O-antigen/teichoic acid export membrane protein
LNSAEQEKVLAFEGDRDAGLMISSEAIEVTGESIAANVGRGAGAFSIGAVLNMVAQFALVPVAMYGWNPTAWGEWNVLMAIVTPLAMSDLGMQSFIVNEMCIAYSQSGPRKLLRTLNSSLVILVPIVLILLGILTVTLPFARLGFLLGFTSIGGLGLAISVLLLAFDPLVRVPVGAISGIYRATGRLPRGVMFDNLRIGLQLLATLAVIWTGAGFLSVAAVRALVVILVSMLLLVDLRKVYPWLKLTRALGDWRQGQAMIVPGLFFLMMPIANWVGNEFILIILQHGLGGIAVSEFATHRTATNCGRMISSVVVLAAWPELTVLYSRGDQVRLLRAHRMLVKWSLWLVSAVTLCVVLLLPSIYREWTHNRLTIEPLTLGLLSARVAVWGFWNGSMTLLLAINRQRSVAFALVGAALIGGLLAIPLVEHMGVAGAALAVLIGDVCVPAWLIPLYACRETGDKYTEFIADTCILPVVSGTAAVLLVFVCQRYYSTAFFAVPLGGMLGLVVTYLFSARQERKMAVRLARQVVVTLASMFQRADKRPN